MATHSSILDSEISWTEEPGRLHTEVFLGIKWHMSTTYSNHQEKKIIKLCSKSDNANLVKR